MATSTIFNFNFNNSEIVDSTGQWYNATTGTPTTEFIEHDGNTALLQRAYVAETSRPRDINPVFFQSRDPTFTAHTYTIELQIYPLRDSGGFGPWDGPVLEFNTESDEEGWVSLVSVQMASLSNTFYWHEYGLGPDGTGIPFLTVTAADGTYNRWYSIRIERVDDGANTGATIKIYVDGTLVVNETLTYPQDARRGRIGSSIRYTYRQNSTSPMGAGVAIDNFKLTAGIAPSSVVDVSLANLQRNNANLLSFIKGKVPTVNDGTLTIKVNGSTAGTFTANQSTNATANITVPTKTSDLTNDSGFITSDDTKIPLAGSNAISGSLIPATTDAYDLGGPSYQWNNAYIKSLTINGVACGDILTHNASEFVNVTGAQTIGGSKTFNSQIRGTIDKSKDYYLQGNTLASENGSLGIVKYYSATSTADLDTEIFEHSLWAASKAVNSIPTTLDVFYYVDQYFYGGRTSTSSRIQILRGYRNANLHMVRVYDTNSWSAWAKFADESDVVPRSGGAVMTNSELGRTIDNGSFNIHGGIDSNSGTVRMYGKDYDTAGLNGCVRFTPQTSSSNAKNMVLKPDGTWTWNGTACQITSDQRLKQQISQIDDKLLDAWEDVTLVQFKYNDAVDAKKDKARLHTGYVVQQIDSACKSHNVDISEYGLYCHEEYPEETEEVEVEQADGTKVKERKVIREASEHYSLRYTEVYAVECMYLRRCIARLTARIEELEKGKEQEASK